MARPLLETALQLAPNDPQVLAVFGLLEGNEDNVTAELDYYARSLALNPSSGEVLNWNRMALYDAGQMEASLETNLRMIEVDPMSMITLYNGIASMLNTPHEDDQKIEELLQRLFTLDKGYGLSARAMVENQNGNLPAAVSLYFEVLELDPGRSSSRNDLAMLLALIGFSAEANLVAPDLAHVIEFFNADWKQTVDTLQERYNHDPSLNNTTFLMTALAEAGDTDAAFQLAQALWSEFGANPSRLGSAALTMTWVAMKTEHPVEAKIYRDAAGRFVQRLIEAEFTDGSRYRHEATLAALDNREDDAIRAISLGLDKGFRWHYGLQRSVYERLRDNPGFQSLVNRQRELIESDRQEVKAMLCGPDTILTTWEPAPETCL
jgi:hypothetical protein